MDILDIRAVRRSIKEEQIGALLKDYADTERQKTSALGAADRNRLDRQACEIWERIEALERELKEMELAPPVAARDSAGPDRAQVHRELRAKLPEIDFEALERALRTILNTPRDDGCAALLLFQHSAKMGANGAPPAFVRSSRVRSAPAVSATLRSSSSPASPSTTWRRSGESAITLGSSRPRKTRKPSPARSPASCAAHYGWGA
jgi:hypothetical protein